MKSNSFVAKKRLTVHLGAALRAARQEVELTQEDVAERVGVATEVYGRMERGHATPSVPNLRRLCVVLRLDANVALGLNIHAAAWLKESVPTSEDPPRLRRLLRTLRQLGDDHLAALSTLVRAFAQHS